MTSKHMKQAWLWLHRLYDRMGVVWHAHAKSNPNIEITFLSPKLVTHRGWRAFIVSRLDRRQVSKRLAVLTGLGPGQNLRLFGRTNPDHDVPMPQAVV